MDRIEKTVFLSYRRTNIAWALAIHKDLTQNGYDVFLDFTGIGSGDFESVILENIRARAHFIVLLTPSALERCREPADWLRREIEAALDIRRNIVPVMLEDFDFGAPGIAAHLTGRLSVLKSYNALRVPVDYFDEAMQRLRNSFLKVPLAAVLHPASVLAQRAAGEQKAAANAAPKVEETELFALRFFEQGFSSDDLDDQVRLFTEAIRLKPNYPDAFVIRGLARQEMGDVKGALKDYSEAIRIKPNFAMAFDCRGILRLATGDLDGAMEDFNEAIRIEPDFADGFQNRGRVRFSKGDLEGALRDFNEAIRLRPDLPEAFAGRGQACVTSGDLEGGLKDLSEAIRLMPDCAEAFAARAGVRRDKGDLDGALLDYGELLRLEPEDAIAFSNRGHVRVANGDVEGALMDYNEAIRLRPAYAKAFAGRAIAHLQRGDFDASMKDLNEAIRLAPDDADARFNRGRLRRFYAGDMEAAALDESEALRLGYKPH